MTRNHVTVGLFIAAALLGGVYVGTGAAPVAFGAGVAPEQATAANWSLFGGLGAAIGGLINLFRGGGLSGPIKQVTDVLADGKVTRDEIIKIVGDVLRSGGNGDLGGTIKNVIDVTKKTEQTAVESALRLICGEAGLRGDREVLDLMAVAAATITANWYGGSQIVPDVASVLVDRLLRLPLAHEVLKPVLDAIRGVEPKQFSKTKG